MKVDIIELYASDDENCCMGTIYTYMFIDGELLLAGNEYKNIDDMIHGAQALLHFQSQQFTTDIHRVPNAALYYEYQNNPDKIYEYVVGETDREKTSQYGSF